MNYLKNLGISFLWIICTILVLTFIITFLNYFNIISDKIISIFKILIPIISLFIGGIQIGKRSKNKGTASLGRRKNKEFRYLQTNINNRYKKKK